MSMNEEPNRKSHWKIWVISGLAALVLYVLSFGPYIGLYKRGVYPPVPDLFEWIYSPLEKATIWDNPLKAPLRAYVDWWIEILKKP